MTSADCIYTSNTNSVPSIHQCSLQLPVTLAPRDLFSGYYALMCLHMLAHAHAHCGDLHCGEQPATQRNSAGFSVPRDWQKQVSRQTRLRKCLYVGGRLRSGFWDHIPQVCSFINLVFILLTYSSSSIQFLFLPETYKYFPFSRIDQP